MPKSTKKRGSEAFEEYYTSIYQERWPTLRDSLLASKHHIARQNQFIPDRDSKWVSPDSVSQHDSRCNESNLREYYFMDLASCWAAEILPLPNSGGEILDLCAAPGGKSLILAERMHSEASLTLNELSPQRRHRLKNVLRDYVPEEIPCNAFK